MRAAPQPVSFNLHSLRNICQADQCECIHLSSAGLHGTSMGTHTHTHSHTHTHTQTRDASLWANARTHRSRPMYHHDLTHTHREINKHKLILSNSNLNHLF